MADRRAAEPRWTLSLAPESIWFLGRDTIGGRDVAWTLADYHGVQRSMPLHVMRAGAARPVRYRFRSSARVSRVQPVARVALVGAAAASNVAACRLSNYGGASAVAPPNGPAGHQCAAAGGSPSRACRG
jgi:hypothetical protein